MRRSVPVALLLLVSGCGSEAVSVPAAPPGPPVAAEQARASGPLPKLARGTLAFDWSALSDTVQPQTIAPLEAADADVLRCMLAADTQASRGPIWVVLRVDDNGSVIVDRGDTSTAPSKSEHCVRGTLGTLRFPDTRGTLAISVLYALSPPGAPEPMLGSPWSLVGTSEGGGGRGEASRHAGPGERGHVTKRPAVRLGSGSGALTLPPEAIQLTIRRSSARIRLCYADGLRRDPALSGRVSTTFVIAADGSVSSASATGDLPDSAVIECVGRAFLGLSFPLPEGGRTMKVTYPIAFSPDDPASSALPPAGAAPSPSSVPKVGGKLLAEVDMPVLEAALQRSGFETRRLPGFDPRPGARNPVVVLFRNDLGIGVARIVDGGMTDAQCARSHGGKSLIISPPSPFCSDALGTTLDP